MRWCSESEKIVSYWAQNAFNYIIKCRTIVLLTSYIKNIATSFANEHFYEKCEILCNFCSAQKILMKLLSETRKMLKLPLSDVIFVAVSLLDFSVHVPDNKITWQLCAVNCRANNFFLCTN